jgi:hypothetical protein
MKLRILGQIAEGGQNLVFLAESVEDKAQQQFALKMAKTDKDPKNYDLLIEEFEKLKKLQGDDYVVLTFGL